jgi:hypothetical protein
VEVSSARFFLSSRFLLRCFLVFNRELLLSGRRVAGVTPRTDDGKSKD